MFNVMMEAVNAAIAAPAATSAASNAIASGAAAVAHPPSPAWGLFVVTLAVVAIIYATLKMKLPAFLSLLVVAICAGFMLGASADDVIKSIRGGMGDTLGFVAVVIGLGALLGSLLESSGGIEQIAHLMLSKVNEKWAPWVIALVGMIVGTPLFFEVAFVVIAPFLIGLAISSKKSILYFAVPALAGMGIMHALVPPHPGAVAATDALHANFGLVMLYGFICGLPAIFISGPIFAKIAFGNDGKMAGEKSAEDHAADREKGVKGIAPLGAGFSIFATIFPVVLIMMGAFAPKFLPEGSARDFLGFVGHPFIALALASMLVWSALMIKKSDAGALLGVMGKALEPAGSIALVIGSGAVFKQILVNSGMGDQLTQLVADWGMSPLVFGFVVAAILRIAQGSATVAIVTSVGMTAPLVTAAGYSDDQTALVVTAIGAGSIIVSHVNDAGFWLIRQYLGLTEMETFKSWTMCVTIGGFVAFAIALGLSYLV